MKRFNYFTCCILGLATMLPAKPLYAQRAHITEEVRTLTTYPFDDPNPIPFLVNENKRKIYPYHGFDGYSLEGIDRDWKVVKLENDYIEVYVLPEAGGKVWGAIEKSTGKEFLYLNKVMKFRNVALRGPWTSGGIEFNFGYIGHTPSTATPVDYLFRENPDGSVSCIVGAMDLPSRTHWRVEIRLPADKAWFETKATWYNPTPVVQSYYNWMTGAARVSDDLQFFYPGTMEYEHNGSAFPWPVDSLGRDLSWYANNDFGSHKSFHIAGTYNDFMGGYYHDDDFGFGHWALHDDMPGKKLWLWAQSRNGGIWEDLLTDTDGQYMEFQAGRTYNQYSPSSYKSPITQLGFLPGTTDHWRELWFPVKETGGLSAVSPLGILHAEEQAGNVHISINALATVETPVILRAGNDTLFRETIRLNPMEVYTKLVDVPAGTAWEVSADYMDLRYGPDKQQVLKRPTASASPAREYSTSSQYYHEGLESKEFRDYQQAKQHFAKSIALDPYHLDALAEMAGLQYRSGLYDSTFYYANRVLREDTYHPLANFQAGNAYVAEKDWVNALDCFGWASRSIEYRSEAFAQMAAIYLQQHQPDLALHYANKAIGYNQHHVFALQAKARALRMLDQSAEGAENLRQLYEADPLNHFARYEEYLNGKRGYEEFSTVINNEFAWQTHLELALIYCRLGAEDEALRIMAHAPAHPIITLWQAYLTKDTSRLKAAAEAAPDFVFPYRLETIEALEWATKVDANWKFKYYLALNYYHIGRVDDAAYWLQDCGDDPDYAPFFLTRSSLLQADPELREKDILRAYHLAPDDWRTRVWMIEHYHRAKDFPKALATADRAWRDFKGDYTIGMWYARQLLLAHRPKESSAILGQIHVLPYEGASQGRTVYEQALLMQALTLIKDGRYRPAIDLLDQSREWPEHLGVGKPYQPDNRFQDYLMAYCLRKLGRTKEADTLSERVIAYTVDNYRQRTFAHLLGLMAIKQAGDQERLDALLQQLRSADSAENKWTLAAFDQGELSNLKIPAVFDQNPYFFIITEIVNMQKP